MDFPTIHTNFWDAVIAVPVVMILTQIIKKTFKIQKHVPLVATILGYAISIFISHRGDLVAGILMGYFLWVCRHWKLRHIKELHKSF